MQSSIDFAKLSYDDLFLFISSSIKAFKIEKNQNIIKNVK